MLKLCFGTVLFYHRDGAKHILSLSLISAKTVSKLAVTYASTLLFHQKA
jgi:hypothetical protein